MNQKTPDVLTDPEDLKKLALLEFRLATNPDFRKRLEKEIGISVVLNSYEVQARSKPPVENISDDQFIEMVKAGKIPVKFIDQIPFEPTAFLNQPPEKRQELADKFFKGEITFAQLSDLTIEMAEVLLQMGQMMLQNGKYDEASKFFLYLVMANPYSYLAHLHLGTTLMLMSRLDDAIFELNLANGLEPDNLFVLVNRAEVYIRSGEVVKAFEDLKRAAELGLEGSDPIQIRGKAMAIATATAVQKLLELQKQGIDITKIDFANDFDSNGNYTAKSRRAETIQTLKQADDVVPLEFPPKKNSSDKK